MEEPNKDLKDGEEETPTGAGQSDKETPKPDGSKEDGTTGSNGDPEEEVKISKSELEQLRKNAEDGKNYRKAFLKTIRGNGRNLPGSEPVAKKKVDKDDDDFDNDKINTDEFVTKTELSARDEKRAINDACKDDDVLVNWDDIVVFYQRPRENSYESQSVAIQSAVKRWKADRGITDKPEDDKEAKKIADKAKQELSSDKGLSNGKDKKPTTPPRKTIIPHKEGMENWYPKK